MIIPVRCFTCNKVISDKWDAYVRLCESERAKDDATPPGEEPKGKGRGKGNLTQTQTRTQTQTPEARALDKLGIANMCCRVCMLSHVDLSAII